MSSLTVKGLSIYKGYISPVLQAEIVDVLRGIVRQAPLVQPETRFGKKMSVRMTAAGQYGWMSDRAGYRYMPHHPSGVAWPSIPQQVLSIWDDVTGLNRRPDCCLINFYGPDAKMGMHQDRDEADFSWPVVSISLGDDARFRMGNVTKGGSTKAVWLQSGDVVVMGGAARLAYHGVDMIRHGSSQLLSDGGRLNLTLRVVT
ncbi:MAG: alpha-ketoglutarate-dependent dioxygenase AlkB [Pseudomonadota bacterium]